MRTGGLRLLGLRCVALVTAACGAPFASGVSGHGDPDATAPTPEASLDSPSSTAPRGSEGGLQTNEEASDAGAGDQNTSPPNAGTDDAEAACPGPDTVHGVFVEAGGVPSGTCGDPANACATIAAALNIVGNSGGTKDIVYIRGGTYTEQVTLPPGVTLQGGWLDAGGTWSRPCTGSPSVTIVRAPEGTFTTVVASYSGSSALDSLTLESTDQTAVGPSQSVYGVFATGASTVLSLLDVNIALAAGGGGAAGDNGPDGGAGSAPGSCAAAANGSAGAPGTVGPPGAGSYGASGFAPGAGGAGTSGGSGANGTPGTPPTCADAGAGCAPTQGLFGNLFCQCGQALSSCGTPGAFGCGGAGGGGGSGGAGGGASIGVFDWGALVSLVGGAIVTGGGGAGGNGGSGGGGGMGTQGAAGTGPSLLVGLGACLGLANGGAPSCATCSGGFSSGQAGGPGGPGGAGGPGGEGAGGGGGDSFCYYQGGSGVVDVASSVTCSPGAGGPGGNQGLAGQGATGATGLHN